jgi:hypothetical protein
MENFSKFKDWLLGGVLLFIAAIAIDIRDKVYELDKKTVLIEYRIIQLEKADESRTPKSETAYMQIGDFIMPTKVKLNNDEDGDDN